MFARHRKTAKKSKFGPKSTTIAAYSGVFLLIMSMVAIGYQPPEKVDNVANVASALSVGEQSSADQPSVDEIVATNVAAKIADRANMPVAPNIANQSVSLTVQRQLAQTTGSSIAKPQIVQSTGGNRAVEIYVVKKGDSVSSIAKDFGISPNTIKWANNLTGNSVKTGKKLKILPVDGILYTVNRGDTLESIASKFNTSVETITVFNDLELTGLVKNKEIVLPSGVLPTEDRPGYVAPSTGGYASAGLPYGTVRFAGGYGGGSLQSINPYTLISSSRNIYSATNGGANGQCTWWAIERRAAMGRPLPGGALGNAADWIYTLSGRYNIDQSPARGAVIQNGGGYGHVGVVESVNGDGSITISEMNNYAAGGAFAVDLRTIPASAVGNFNYIH